MALSRNTSPAYCEADARSRRLRNSVVIVHGVPGALGIDKYTIPFASTTDAPPWFCHAHAGVVGFPSFQTGPYRSAADTPPYAAMSPVSGLCSHLSATAREPTILTDSPLFAFASNSSAQPVKVVPLTSWRPVSSIR